MFFSYDSCVRTPWIRRLYQNDHRNCNGCSISSSATPLLAEGERYLVSVHAYERYLLADHRASEKEIHHQHDGVIPRDMVGGLLESCPLPCFDERHINSICCCRCGGGCRWIVSIGLAHTYAHTREGRDANSDNAQNALVFRCFGVSMFRCCGVSEYRHIEESWAYNEPPPLD